MSSTLARKLADAPPVTFEPKKQAAKTSGKPLRVVGININVTDRKASELALVDEIARRKVLLERASEFIFVLDRRMRLIEMNRSFVRALGYEEAELLALRPWDWDALTPRKEAFLQRWSSQSADAWTVASLAELVGRSRSAFAAR